MMGVAAEAAPVESTKPRLRGAFLFWLPSMGTMPAPVEAGKCPALRGAQRIQAYGVNRDGRGAAEIRFPRRAGEREECVTGVPLYPTSPAPADANIIKSHRPLPEGGLMSNPETRNTPSTGQLASPYPARHARLAEELQRAGMDALVLNPGPTLTYLTGLHFHLMERPVVAIFTPGQPTVIVLPELETGKLESLPYAVE